MDNINLGDLNMGVGGDSKAEPKPGNDASSKPEEVKKPASISINFTPTIPSAAAKPAMPPVENSTQPKLIKMEVKREDLKKDDVPVKAELPPKKGFLSGIFGKKAEVAPVQAKPSTAWSSALDVPKVVSEPLAVNKAPAVASPAASNLTDKPAAPLVQPVNLTPKTPDKTEFFSSNALQEKAGGSKLMENITSQKAQLEKPKMADLLGKKSTILEKSIEQESQLKLTKKLRMMQSAALFAAVVAVAANGYFYYQLSPGADLLGFAKYNFDSNLRNDLFNLNQSLKSVQTDLNKYRYLTGQLYLNQFGYESTRFVDGIANLENPSQVAEKSEIQSIVAEAKNKMPSLLAGVKKNLAQSVTVDTYTTRGEETVDPTMIESEFQRELRLAISSEKKTLRDNSSQSNLEVPVSALAFFDNAAKLVGNGKLISNLNARTVDAFKTEADQYEQSNDAAQRAAFRGYIDNLLASTKVNLATISNLRNSRIKWSEVIDRIEKITNKVNSEHNSGLGSGNASKIEYSSFDFNSETGKVSVSGINTTQSGTNREVITYLLEAFEASPEFKNVSNRSFPVSKNTALSGSNSYTLNFKIDMDTEKGAFSKLNAPIADLAQGKNTEIKVPVKRNQ
jgi:hypothetical protein